MNAQTRITADLSVCDIDLSEIIRREGIEKIGLYVNRFSVVLFDGRLGIGETVGEALAKAKQADAQNVRNIAA
jgi:hypothetical protein